MRGVRQKGGGWVCSAVQPRVLLRLLAASTRRAGRVPALRGGRAEEAASAADFLRGMRFAAHYDLQPLCSSRGAAGFMAAYHLGFANPCAVSKPLACFHGQSIVPICSHISHLAWTPFLLRFGAVVSSLHMHAYASRSRLATRNRPWGAVAWRGAQRSSLIATTLMARPGKRLSVLPRGLNNDGAPKKRLDRKERTSYSLIRTGPRRFASCLSLCGRPPLPRCVGRRSSAAAP